MQQLLDAGVRFVGKTVANELTFSINGNNAHFGAPINGAALDRIPGGSSSGWVSAVSNNLCDFALCSETGSLACAPVNHCGLYGIQPMHGRVKLASILSLAPSLDTCGYFARDIETFARISGIFLGEDQLATPTNIWMFEPLDLWTVLVDPEDFYKYFRYILDLRTPLSLNDDDCDLIDQIVATATSIAGASNRFTTHLTPTESPV